MKVVGIVSTAVLSLILAAPVYAQEQHDQEQEKASLTGTRKKAQPERAAKPEEKSAKPEEKNARQENSAKPEQTPRQNSSPANRQQPRSRQRRRVAAFRPIVTRPISGANTAFG